MPSAKAAPVFWESESIKTLMSIYGVDLLPDNVEECQMRLYGIWNDAYSKSCKKACNDACRTTAHLILKRNILCGDALTLKQNDGSVQSVILKKRYIGVLNVLF